MNKISDQIMEGMKTAMKAKDTVTLNTLRALKKAWEPCWKKRKNWP